VQYDVLLQSIFTYLETREDLPDIFYPNVSQDTIPNQYLEVHIMPVAPANIGVKDISWHRGIIQINIVISDGVGSIIPATIAQKIIDAFARGTVISTSNIRIDSQPYASAGFNDNKGHYITPVTIPYNKLC